MMQNEILQSLRKTLILALLVTLVILSKQNYWLSLPFSLGIFIWKTLEAQSLPLKTIARNAVILCVVTLSLSSPYYILYPLSQGDYSGKAELMRAQRSSPNFRPVNSLNKSYRMASKGKPFTAVALSKDWMDNSLKSLYGLFGYFQLKLPGELYRFLGWVAVLLLLDVILTTVLDWRNFSGFQRFLLIGSFVSVNLHFLGSMYNSWTYDFQPQGRYLFSMIPALACFLFLTAHQPFRWKKIFRGSVLVLGMVLSVVTLSLVLSSPILR